MIRQTCSPIFVLQAALEAIQRWSELHQKQQENASAATREDQAYLPIVIKACYDVFDYPQGWLVDITVCCFVFSICCLFFIHFFSINRMFIKHYPIMKIVKLKCQYYVINMYQC